MKNKTTGIRNKSNKSKKIIIVLLIIGIFISISLIGGSLLFLGVMKQGGGLIGTNQLMSTKMAMDSVGGMRYMETNEIPNLENPNAEPYDTTFFENYGVNPFISTEDEKFSTFGMDVDTASYTVVRRWLMDGNYPDKDSVRTEEFINYFDQDYDNPEDDFGIYVEGAKSEFGGDNYHLLKIGVKAKEVTLLDRKPANMIFLVDVSGSMSREDRLELVKDSLTKLAKNLKDGDKVGLAVYAGGGGKVLDLTSNKNKIINALSELKSGGSTNLDEGLEIAYDMARDGFEDDKINRIIICSDGVANVGTTGAEALLEKIKKDSDKGITLTTLGFGMGNYNDVLMEKLANHGDGNYYYIDSEDEADRLFENGATSMLQVIGSDAKIQVEFNEDTVDRFRLLGYENRRLETEDFEDDSVDAGEVGAGQTVTALYEVRIKDDARDSEDLATVRIRYADVDSGDVTQINKEVKVSDMKNNFDDASERFRLTASVAEFAEILKESYWAKDGDLNAVFDVAKEAVDDMSYSEKTDEDEEFIDLIKKAIKIDENREDEESDDDGGLQIY